MEIEINKPFEFSTDEFLWRYLDLHKFLSFILEKKLFFTRLDKFDDPLEGLTEEIIYHMAAYEKEIIDNYDIANDLKAERKKSAIKRKSIIEEKTKLNQTTLFANCWFINKKESIAMWNLYSNPDSVAIRYNPNNLLSIVKASAESYTNVDLKKILYGIV